MKNTQMRKGAMRSLMCPGFAMLLSLDAVAENGIGMGIGTNVGRGDNEPIDFYRVTYKWDWEQSWFKDGNWFVKAHNELSVIRLSSDFDVKRKYAKSSLNAIALTPIFRLQRVAYANGLAPFVEGGIGVAYFSESKIQSQPYWFRDFGGHFQFEDRISVGLLYKEKYKLSIDFTHYSNANISGANEGLDLISVSFSFNY